MDKSQFLECHLPLNIDGILSIVTHILKSLGDSSLTDLLIIFYKEGQKYVVRDGDEQSIVDIVLTLNNYLYEINEIAEVVLEWVRILIFAQKMKKQYDAENISMEVALIQGHAMDWIKKYYDCRITKLRVYEGDSFTRFWLPEKYIFLEERYEKEFLLFDRSSYKPPKFLQSYFDGLCDNTKIFFYQCHPQKILPYENLKRMFIELILPQHFAFRSVSERIYIPDYISKITLPVFDSNLFSDKEIFKNTEIGNIIIL
jgi:hypothetical protein